METKAELEADIVTTLGGRAAEELKFESVTTGAANDIEQATKTVRAMITMYGMSDTFGLMQLESVQGKYLDRNAVLQCSDETAAKVDEEIRKVLSDSYDKAKKLLADHMDTLFTYYLHNMQNSVTDTVLPERPCLDPSDQRSCVGKQQQI